MAIEAEGLSDTKPFANARARFEFFERSLRAPPSLGKTLRVPAQLEQQPSQVHAQPCPNGKTDARLP